MTEDEDRSLRIMKRSPLNAYLQVEREMLTLETTIHDTAENFTKPVLTALCKAGRYFDYTVWASRVDDEHRNGGGWLYDVTWCEANENNRLKSIPLVAECEWGNAGACLEDFEKLLVAKADLKIMVYDAGKYEYDDGAIIAQGNELFGPEIEAFEGADRPGFMFFARVRLPDEDPGQRWRWIRWGSLD